MPSPAGHLDWNVPDGPSAIAYTSLYDYDANGNMIYQGWAYSSAYPSGASPDNVPQGAGSAAPSAAAAVWAVRKLTYNASNQLTQVQWANGNPLFVNIWNNRATLNYQ